MEENGRIAVAEAVGTCVLVLGGCGTAVYASQNAATSVGILGIATAFGLSLLVMAYTIGPISGCHINPAVTVGLIAAKKVAPSRAPFYIGGQLVGGLVGGTLLWATFAMSDIDRPAGFASNGYGDHSPSGFDLGSVMIVEVLMTLLLVMVVLGTTHPRFPSKDGSWAVGGALWLIHLISIPVSNTSVNPARSLAVAPFAGDSWAMTQLWAFFVFPLIGAVIGAALWMLMTGIGEQATDLDAA